MRSVLRLAVTLLLLGLAAPAAAASHSASFTVSVTVTATCLLVPTQPPRPGQSACARSAQPAAVKPPTPQVSYERDPKSGLVTQTVVF
jgi:hypothetical protein